MTEAATTPARVPLEEADYATLKQFAGTMLGLEIKNGTNAAQVKAKILSVMPECKDVPAIVAPPEPIVRVVEVPAAPAAAPAPVVAAIPADYVPVEGEDPTKRPAAISRPASNELIHASLDPKVKLVIAKTDDKKRAREVTICVNGDVTRIQRGHEVNVPYRVYLALLNAKEKAAVPGDDINPVTGDPIMVWEEVYSYPFSVHAMPSAEEIAAWEAATGSGFKNVA